MIIQGSLPQLKHAISLRNKGVNVEPFNLKHATGRSDIKDPAGTHKSSNWNKCLRIIS